MTRSDNPRRAWVVLAVITVVTVLVAGGAVWLLAFHGGHTQPPAGQGSPTPAEEVTSPAPGTPSESPSADCAEATVAGLSLEELVGQLLMVGTPVNSPTGIATAVRQYHLGGVFLAGRSTQRASTLAASTKALQQAAVQDTGVPLQIALDQEGGTVQTLSGPDFPTIPSAVTQGTWSESSLRSRSADTAKRLRAAGITMDLAPIADTVPAGTAAQNPPIGQLDRQFGYDPAKVGPDVATVVKAVQGAGVAATIKHFPGLGRVRANTDTSTEAVDELTTAQDPFLGPFSAGIKAGTGAVMISSARYPKLDSKNIAAFSSAVITDLLREKLGFTGVVISDDLGAAKAPSIVPLGQRAVKFIAAGGDVVLTVRSSDAGPMSAALIAQAKQSPQFADRVRDAAKHVIAAKVSQHLLGCGASPTP
jgi:beta-N-acetylhexosaminidase